MAHRYWRLNARTNNASSFWSFATLEFRATAGGANTLSGGTASASSQFSGSFSADKAVDGNNGTWWVSNGSIGATSYPRAWWSYDYGVGAGPSTVDEIRIVARSDTNVAETPLTGDISYSDDGILWFAYGSFSAAAWTLGAAQVLTVTPYTYVSYNGTDTKTRWRLLFNGNTSAATAHVSLNKIEFRATPGAADQATGGTPSSSTNLDASTTAAKAFDTDDNSNWQTAVNSTVGSWVEYQFGAGVAVQQIFVKDRVDGSWAMAPGDITLQYHDGAAFVSVVTWTNLPWTAAFQFLTLTVPGFEPTRQVQVGAVFAEVMYVNASSIRIAGVQVEIARFLAAGDTHLDVGGAFVEIGRSSAVNPIRIGGQFIEVGREGPAFIRSAGIIAEVGRDGAPAIQVAGIIIEVGRSTSEAASTSSAFNRAVTMIT